MQGLGNNCIPETFARLKIVKQLLRLCLDAIISISIVLCVVVVLSRNVVMINLYRFKKVEKRLTPHHHSRGLLQLALLLCCGWTFRLALLPGNVTPRLPRDRSAFTLFNHVCAMRHHEAFR